MISARRTLPEILAEHPSTRSVFDRYGLHGCGGAAGPPETVETFARIHGIRLETLLAELEAAVASGAPPAGYREELGDVLYRRFFRGSIAALLTAGATLGAGLLLLYTLRRSFTSLELLPFVQAHANAQVFGFVGLFVMGFALQGLPRFKYVKLKGARAANFAFVLMLTGLGARTVAPLLFGSGTPLALAGGAIQAAAVAVLLGVVARTLSSSTLREPWDRYVKLSLLFLLVAALAEPAVTYAFHAAPSAEVLVRRIADVAGPFRDVQVLGFAGLMIFGVAQRILPTAFGFRECGARASSWAFTLLAGGLLLDIGAWVAFRQTRAPAWAVASWAGTCGYAAGALILMVSLRGLTGGGDDRSRKFIRAAFAWLLLACVLVFVQPAYVQALGLKFSHAYGGAIRHAFTVGFVSLMIVGVSLKVVPMLVGAEPRRLPSMRGAFLLIVGGNALRVLSQILTDVVPSVAYPFMAASGAFVVLGFLGWGLHVWSLMSPRAAESWSKSPATRVEADMTPAEVLRWFPETLEVFVAHGFEALANPLLRRTLGRSVTLTTACAMKRVDLDRLLKELNRRING